MNTDNKVPVTILTGFLGSGKTTLLNRILGEEHGKRIAVIENEYGEVGIDQGLVIDADEEVFEMSNGCICCTVRGDLIRVLGNLMKRRDKFDYVLVETTGLADPGPVAQTFFMDEEISSEFTLDGIVTLVDAAHIDQQLGRSNESETLAREERRCHAALTPLGHQSAPPPPQRHDVGDSQQLEKTLTIWRPTVHVAAMVSLVIAFYVSDLTCVHVKGCVLAARE